MQSKKSKWFTKFQKYENSIFIGGTIIVVALVLFRALFGCGVFDESLYISMAKQFAEGSVPVATVWFKAPFYPLFYFWLLPVYRFFAGGYDGLMLFMRFCFVVFKAILFIFTYRLLYKQLNRYILWVFLAAQFLVNFAHISNFSYNTIPQYMLLPCLALIFRAFEGDDNRKSNRFATLGGIAAAFTAIAYPPQAILAIILCIIIFCMTVYLKKTYSIFLSYIAAGTAVAVVFVATLLLWGGIANFKDGIDFLLNNSGVGAVAPDGRGPLQMIISDIIKPFAVLVVVFAVFFNCFRWIAAILSRCGKILKKKPSILLCLVLSQISVTFYYASISAPHFIVDAVGSVGLFIFPLYLLFLKKSKPVFLKLFLFFYLPFIFFYIINGCTNAYGITARAYLFFPIALLSLFSLYEALNENTKKVIADLGCGALGVAMLILSLVCAFSYVYDDEALPFLNSRITSGVHKGIYTTDGRKVHVEKLEKNLRSITQKGDTVVLVIEIRGGYLMTDATCGASNPWTEIEYFTNEKSSKNLLKYFEHIGSIPNKIIFTQYQYTKNGEGFTDVINDFLEEYYHLPKEELSFIVYEKI